MPEPKKKAAKKRATKKSASSAPAQQPRERKNIADVVKLLRDNPEYGIAFHKYFEDKILQLNRAGWGCGTEYADKKHVWGAQCLTTEVLDEFNLWDLVRN